MFNPITLNNQSNINIQKAHEKEVEEINTLISKRMCTIYKSISYKGSLTDLTISYYRSKGFTVKKEGWYFYISWNLDLNIGEEILYKEQYYKIDWIYGGKLCLINNKEKIIVNEEDLIK